MSYEKVIEQVKETPPELLDEVSTFLMFLKYRTQNSNQGKKSFDADYNELSSKISGQVTNAAKATIWEQIKDDTW